MRKLHRQPKIISKHSCVFLYLLIFEEDFQAKPHGFCHLLPSIRFLLLTIVLLEIIFSILLLNSDNWCQTMRASQVIFGISSTKVTCSHLKPELFSSTHGPHYTEALAVLFLYLEHLHYNVCSFLDLNGKCVVGTLSNILGKLSRPELVLFEQYFAFCMIRS